jgi:DNA-binding response OmpR family regulator
LRSFGLKIEQEASIRESTAMLLSSAGYDISTAGQGLMLFCSSEERSRTSSSPTSTMPQMSGFEFLSVSRRRFPQILVVAVRGAFESGDRIPGGVIADAFYSKGRHYPEELSGTVAELIRTRAAREINH